MRTLKLQWNIRDVTPDSLNIWAKYEDNHILQKH